MVWCRTAMGLLLLLTKALSNAQYAEPGHRRLEAVPESRHNEPPPRKHIGDVIPQSKFTHLMQSNCRPEANGYFGSTAGIPAVIEYGFQLETTMVANVDRILDIIDDSVMDEVLAGTFTSICGFQRRLNFEAIPGSFTNDPRITGFRFDTEQADLSATCEPQVHPKNTCGYYKSTVQVFGRNIDADSAQETIDHIIMALQNTLVVVSNDGAVRLEVSQALTQQVSGPGYGESRTRSGNMSAAAKAGLAMSILVLIVGIAVLIAYFVMEVRHSNSKKKRKKSSVRRNRECWDIMRYFENGSLTNTWPESDYSEERKSLPFDPRDQRVRRSKSTREQARNLRRPLECDAYYFDDRPIVLEFGASFDPDRDRYLKDLEEESSCPPDYVFGADYYDESYHDHGERLQII